MTLQLGAMDKLTIAENLSAAPARSCDRPHLRAAAVLLPIFPAESGSLKLCLIRRTQTMRNHAGQIAFPGGGFEDADEELVRTAVRETQEELGIHPTSLQILGTLDEVWVPSGYRLTPFVGWMDHLPDLTPNPVEVAEVMCAELNDLMNPKNFREELLQRANYQHRMVAFDIPGGPIWGATARVLFRFLQLAFGWRADDVQPWEVALDFSSTP